MKRTDVTAVARSEAGDFVATADTFGLVNIHTATDQQHTHTLIHEDEGGSVQLFIILDFQTLNFAFACSYVAFPF